MLGGLLRSVGKSVFLCAIAFLAFNRDVSAAPLISGNVEIAADYLYGDAHVLLIGDSIQNGLTYYRYQLNQDRTVGAVFGPNYPQTSMGGLGSGTYYPNLSSTPTLSAYDVALADQTPADGVTGGSPGATAHMLLSGNAPQPDTTFISNSLGGYTIATAFAHTTGPLQFGVLAVANPNGTNAVNFDVLSTTARLATMSLDTRAASTQLRSQSMTLTSGTGDDLIAQFRVNSTPNANANVIVAGVRVTTGQPGFQTAYANWGGKKTDYFVDPANVSDADLARYLAFTDTNVVQIWIGQNDGIPGSEWEPKIKALIARYKQARPGIHFILESTYYTGQPFFAQYADVLNDIAQNDPDVLFLNMYEALGGDNIDPSLLGDGVHPSADGAPYMVDVEQSLLEQAAAAAALAPEPSGALTAIVAIGLGCFRRRRRR
jgi:lysophospholipase L1-like esterase